ncbi:hypothetical protein KIPB_009485 [Kipferlia bialata]|uniref:Uncharacterized protein n=1 Tax=Kipferlia bialata TaxID=797122 RepID=A0A9K3D4C2_9EUKA|nr:hypothetical protein KIPB_009485 [Kipferlia bialata]|eukprot:g9485.t1
MEVYRKGTQGAEQRDETHVSHFVADNDLHILFHVPSEPSRIRHICYSKGVWRDVPRPLPFPKNVMFYHTFQVCRVVYIIGQSCEIEEDIPERRQLSSIAGYDTVSGEWTDYIQTAFSCYAGAQVSPEIHLLRLHRYHLEEATHWHCCQIDVAQIQSKGGMLTETDWGHAVQPRWLDKE